MLGNSKTEIQYRLDIENQNLSDIEQKIRDIEKYGALNPFDFNDFDQHNDEIILNDFLDLAENKTTKYARTPTLDVIVDIQRNNYPFVLNGELKTNNGELFKVIRFYKESNQLTKSIEKV